MDPISFKRHRFPGAVIVRAVRWYFRFTLSIRDVEELMAERLDLRVQSTPTTEVWEQAVRICRV